MKNNLKVYYENRIVGTIAIAADRTVAFQYDETWTKDGFAINPLSMPLSNKVYQFKPTLSNPIFGVFADSLPDGWGTLLTDKLLKQNGFDITSINVLDRLMLLNTNTCKGALIYKKTPSKITERNTEYDLDFIQEECDKILDEINLDDYTSISVFASSSGGARPKILTKIDGKPHIIKFKCKYDHKNISNIEYFYSQIAKKCGVNVPDCRIIKTKKSEYFAIERFDRNYEEKIHMISAAGLLDVNFSECVLDYIDLIKLTYIVTSSYKDSLEMFRRMVFNVEFNNQDDHAKNFSYLFDKKARKYVLSPAYDLTNSHTYYGEHVISVNGKCKNITYDDYLEVAKKTLIKVNDAKEIIDHIKLIKQKNLTKLNELIA